MNVCNEYNDILSFSDLKNVCKKINVINVTFISTYNKTEMTNNVDLENTKIGDNFKFYVFAGSNKFDSFIQCMKLNINQGFRIDIEGNKTLYAAAFLTNNMGGGDVIYKKLDRKAYVFGKQRTLYTCNSGNVLYVKMFNKVKNVYEFVPVPTAMKK